MAKKTLTQQTQTLDAHSSLGDRPNINDGLDATQLKTRYDRDVNRNKDFLNSTLLSELADETLNNSGSNTIGHKSTNITADNVGDGLEEVQVNITGKQDVSNLVTAFQATPDDTHYPSEKLTKDTLDLKSDLSVVRTRTELESQTTTSGTEIIGGKAFNGISADTLYNQLLALKQAVNDATTGTLPNESIELIKLADDVRMTISMGGII